VYLGLFDFQYFSLLNPRYKCHVRCPVPFLPCSVVGCNLFGFGIVLAYFLCRQVHAVFVKYLQVLFRVFNMEIDKVCIILFYLPKKRLSLEAVILYGEQMAFVNLSLFDNGTAFSYLPVLTCDFLLGAYPLACFVKEYASCGNLHIRLRKQLPFAENQMNVVIGLALIVVQCRHTFHAVPPAELICKILKHLLRLVLRVNFGQGDNQLPCLNTFPLCAAALELLPALPCEIIPKGIVGGAVSGVQIFLSCVAGDIRYSSFDIRQLRHLYEAVSCHNPTFL